MDKINVTHIKSLDISKLKNTKVSVVGDSIELEPLPSDESDYERGMRKAMKKIAVSCGRVFGVDVGYEDLPDLVESIVSSKKEKPTPTKFVKVEDSIFDLKKEFERGELYEKGSDYTKLISESDFAFAYRENAVYRQVEIDWRESVIELAPGGYGLLKRTNGGDLSIDGHYNKEQALILANAIIASLTEKP